MFGSQRPPRTNYEQFFRRNETIKVGDVAQVEDVEYPLCSKGIRNEDLPFIPPETVISRDGKEGSKLWIVIDDVVYDCSDFTRVHPGGDNIIQSFGGQNCSWQFWRIHSCKHLEESGTALRVGKTEGIGNRFKEPTKYIGLRALNDDEW